MTKNKDDKLGVLESIISQLEDVAPEDRALLVKMVLTYFGLDAADPTGPKSSSWQMPTHRALGTQRHVGPAFSDDRSMSAKEFMLYKQPKTDVERVACLAFYLTHYRSTPFFKTIDLSQLNTEAAQLKFSNAANAINNAGKLGYLAPGAKGTRQISAVGERFVQALPDREAAREVMFVAHRRRKIRRKT